LSEIKSNKELVYYQTLNKWFGGLHGEPFPTWIRLMLETERILVVKDEVE